MNLDGKNLSDKWVYGVPVKATTNCYDKCIEMVREIEYETDFDYSTYIDSEKIDPKTIGQFTGLYDKNKVPIYERGYNFNTTI